jgi:hypothetical protein
MDAAEKPLDDAEADKPAGVYTEADDIVAFYPVVYGYPRMKLGVKAEKDGPGGVRKAFARDVADALGNDGGIGRKAGDVRFDSVDVGVLEDVDLE